METKATSPPSSHPSPTQVPETNAPPGRRMSRCFPIHEAIGLIPGTHVGGLFTTRSHVTEALKWCKNIHKLLVRNLERARVLLDQWKLAEQDEVLELMSAEECNLHIEEIIGTHLLLKWKLRDLFRTAFYQSFDTDIIDLRILLVETEFFDGIEPVPNFLISTISEDLGRKVSKWASFYSEQANEIKGVIEDLQEALMDDSIWELTVTMTP